MSFQQEEQELFNGSTFLNQTEMLCSIKINVNRVVQPYGNSTLLNLHAMCKYIVESPKEQR